MVQQANKISSRSADINFEYGVALAHLQQWPKARTALLDGWRQCPQQKRFAVELAGVAFELKQYPDAASWLKKALKLDPDDSYANNFVGTVYYLMGDTEIALKYWNRVQKPFIATLHFDPQLKIHRLFLDRSFAFSPAAVLNLPDYETTEARLKGLNIFQSWNIVLNAQPGGTFNADFHAIERDGFGATRLQALVSTFAGAAYETIYPSYFNAGASALNFESLLRWDKEKRRTWLRVSAPLQGRPEWRWQLVTDERDENWSMRRSFTGPAPPLGSLNLERQNLTGSVTGIPSGSLQWTAGAALSHRTYRDVINGSALTSELASPGFEVKASASIEGKPIDQPAHRFFIKTAAQSETARLWSGAPHSFEKLQASAIAHWFPQSSGETYEATLQLRAGRNFGSAPFDELYMVGMERDTSLWARGQIGTRDGRKGSSPLGNQYFLANSDFARHIYSDGLFTLQAGPVLDIAKVGAPTIGLSSPSWIFDTGVQARLKVFGTNFVFIYGRDLRAGSNALFGDTAQ